MRDKKVRELFEQELEIPEVVREKMQEAYREIGADMEKVEMSAERTHTRRHTGRRYLKAASIMLCIFIAAASVDAATGGNLGGKLSKLFSGDVKQIQSSSTQPAATSKKNTFKNLEVTVDQVTGTEELCYVILKVKRTDGKTFKKGKDYSFGVVDMVGENDLVDGFEYYEADSPESMGEQRLMSSYIVDEEEDGGEIKSISETRFVNNGLMIENNGTDEIYLAVSCGYERNDKDGKVSYHKGEKCRLFLKNLCLEDGEDTLMKGIVETEFELDYGESDRKVCEPGKKIELPCYGTEKYVSAGTLDRVMITPYFIKYERSLTKAEMANNTWDQIYVELDDGTRIGNPTQEDFENALHKLGGYGFGEGVITEGDESVQTWSSTEYLAVKDLIDVSRVKAVCFGKTRIEL